MIIPPLLAFTRSISPSVGVFFGVENIEDLFNSKKRVPVEIINVGLATTISHFSDNPEKELEKKGKNVQSTQMAIVPEGCNYCGMEFSVNIFNNFKNPKNCNDLNFRKEINLFVKNYIDDGKIDELAKLYLENIITARFMFRNLSNTSKLKVYIKTDDSNYEFNVLSSVHNIKQFKGVELENVNKLLSEIIDALSGRELDLGDGFKVQKVLNWKVTTIFETYPNAEIYPSQEFIEDSKDKTLTTIRTSANKNQAAFHSQKIGNALRTIDIWYPDFDTEEKGYPLPVEPYGIDRSSESVLRKSESLYKHLEKIDIYNKKGVEDNIKHYIIACLIRGGVYSGKSKKKKN